MNDEFDTWYKMADIEYEDEDEEGVAGGAYSGYSGDEEREEEEEEVESSVTTSEMVREIKL